MFTDVIDSHCHIYPGKIASKAVFAVNTFYEGIAPSPHDGTVGTLLELGKAAGVTHYIVHSVATKPEQVSSINRFIAASVMTAEGAFTGLGTMHPASMSIEKDMDELAMLALCGVKIHPDIQKFNADDKRIMKVYEICEDRGLPIIVHTGDNRYDYSNPPRIINVLRTFPKLKFIGAHFGGWSIWEEASRILCDYPNITVDTSSSFYWLQPAKALEIIRRYGSERVMFGTDYPLWDPKPELEYLAGLGLTDEEMENILRKTCAKLFGIGGYN